MKLSESQLKEIEKQDLRLRAFKERRWSGGNVMVNFIVCLLVSALLAVCIMVIGCGLYSKIQEL